MKQALSEKSANICQLYEQAGACRLLQGSPIPTFVIDDTHTVILWNRACEQITNLAAADVIGTKQPWKAFFKQERPVMADLIVSGASPEEFNRHYGSIWQRSSTIDGAYESEAFFADIGENGTWFFFTASPLTDDNGRLIGAIETLQDITKRKEAEADLSRSRENLEESVRKRTLELEQANEELSQYAFVASHDLRAPLRAVRNYADFLREELEGTLNEEQCSYFDGLGSALKHGDELVTDILEFSRIGNTNITVQPVVLRSFFLEMKEALDIGSECQLVIADDLPTIEADQTLLTQIFTNLVVNGFKFNRARFKKVEIGVVWLRDGACELFVRDNGIGIDPRYHDRIFKMFKRLHTHKEFEGTGIGLAIVRKAVAKLNGSVRVESGQDVGSSFFVTLPLVVSGG